jgi:hypothetical protein
MAGLLNKSLSEAASAHCCAQRLQEVNLPGVRSNERSGSRRGRGAILNGEESGNLHSRDMEAARHSKAKRVERKLRGKRGSGCHDRMKQGVHMTA